jgi:hypothetical protein
MARAAAPPVVVGADQIRVVYPAGASASVHALADSEVRAAIGALEGELERRAEARELDPVPDYRVRAADAGTVLREVGRLPKPDRMQLLADLCTRVPDVVAALLAERAEMLADELPPSPPARVTLTSRPAPGGGRYRLEKVQCGKQCSTCAEGPEHGPYWYLYRRRGGKLVSRYIGKELPAETAAAEPEQAG